MIVMVLPAGGGGAAASIVTPSCRLGRSFRGVVGGRWIVTRAASSGLAGPVSVRTTAIGSPPNGSSLSIAQPAKTASVAPKTPAATSGRAIPRLRRGLRALSRPSGALRSSSVIAAFRPPKSEA